MNGLRGRDTHDRPLGHPHGPSHCPCAGRAHQRLLLRRRRSCRSALAPAAGEPRRIPVAREGDAQHRGACSPAPPSCATRDIALPSLLCTSEGAAWVHDAEGELWRCWEMMPNARSTTRVTGALMPGRPVAPSVRLPGFATHARRLATRRDDPRLSRHAGAPRPPRDLRRAECRWPGRSRTRGDRPGASLSCAGTDPHGAACRPASSRPASRTTMPRSRTCSSTGHTGAPPWSSTSTPSCPAHRSSTLVTWCARASARSAEDTTALDDVVAEPELYRALLEGYLAGTAGLLTPAEIGAAGACGPGHHLGTGRSLPDRLSRRRYLLRHRAPRSQPRARPGPARAPRLTRATEGCLGFARWFALPVPFPVPSCSPSRFSVPPHAVAVPLTLFHSPHILGSSRTSHAPLTTNTTIHIHACGHLP